MTKKRIGNDLHFTWRIWRKDGETLVPETWDGKAVEVLLLDPMRRRAELTGVELAEGVARFTFLGKDQQALGDYLAVLTENRGEEGMVTVDVVRAVTLVPHSYMERQGEESIIAARGVELVSEIEAGTAAAAQADWDAADPASPSYIRNKPLLAAVATTGSYQDLKDKPRFEVSSENDTLIIF